MNESWVKIQRRFSEWQFFHNPDLVRLFIYILINANWKDGKFDGTDVKRGQFMTSKKRLSDTLKVDRATLGRWLKKLENSEILNIKTTNKNTLITINNYNLYQSKENDEHQVNIKRTSSEHQVNTIEEGKKERREESFTPPTVFEVINFFEENGYSAEQAKKAHKYYTSTGWMKSSGNPVKNWKGTMIANWFNGNRNKIVSKSNPNGLVF